MSFFHYQDGRLHAEGVSLARIAREVGTPFYCYSSAALTSAYAEFAGAFRDRQATICYSLKANNNLAVVRSLAALGAGADVVSEGELRAAMAAQVPPERIVFAGVGKTGDEMVAGLEAGILQFNVESLAELRLLNDVATARRRRAPVAIRVNPDVDAQTHAKISTGRSENKFGIDIDAVAAIYRDAAAMPGIAPVGLAMHIGSQLTQLEPYRAAFEKMARLTEALRAAGLPVLRLDLGGGLGIAYADETPPPLADYAAVVERTVGHLGLPLIFEPGRRLVGNAGLLVTAVLYIKQGQSRDFVIVDAAMNDLLRPMLYDAYHHIMPVAEPGSDVAARRVDVVGPICESTDIFAEQRPLPPLAAGDLLAICESGAYGAVMASGYNLRLPAPEVMVRGNDVAIVRPRPTYQDIIGRDRLPDWLAAAEGADAVSASKRRSSR